MKDFRTRKVQAQRRSLDMLPPEQRPPLAASGAVDKACDGCSACCHVQKIEAMGKPPFMDCHHQCEAGCDLHGTGSKPKECVHYRCAYSYGLLTGGAEMRPDVLGLVVDFRASIDRHGIEVPEAGDMIAVWEVRPGVAVSERGLALLESLAELGHALILVPYGAPPTEDGNRITHIKLRYGAGSRTRGAFQIYWDTEQRRTELVRLIRGIVP